MQIPNIMKRQQSIAILLVLGLHFAVLWGLWHHRLISLPVAATTLFVEIIAPAEQPRVPETPKPQPPKPRPTETPPPNQLIAEAAPDLPTTNVAPPPPVTVPAPVTAAPSLPVPAGPKVLSAELAVSCPQRPAPNYPLPSRRMGEAGVTVLLVELDEQGRIDNARIASSSGFTRLDQAALAVVKTWQCNPAQSNGRPVRAIARQAFKFQLQGY